MNIVKRLTILHLISPLLFHSCAPVDEKAKHQQHIIDSITDDSIRLDNLEARIDGRHERWAVKTLADSSICHFGHDVVNVLNLPLMETIADLEKRKLTEVSYHTHRLNFEKTIIEIQGTITSIRAEDDNDIHIELKDPSMGDSTIACEAVDPDDAIAAKSPFIHYFKEVRDYVTRLHEGDEVIIIGVLFEDKYHRPYKYRIRNFLEVHPILKIYSNEVPVD